jgi:lysophospholipase L1-like esterase
MKRRFLAVLFASALGITQAAFADAPDPDPQRFAEAVEAFAAWDRKNAFPENPVLFVGSSSIRLWATANAFPGLPVVNRGFGGSEISDVTHYYDQLIAPYAPARVFLYAGDNDVAGGKPAEQVFEDYKELADRIGRDFPGAELVFISIKPSKARWALWPEMQKANRLVRAYSEQHSQLAYADLASVLLDDSGQPKDVFIEDGLHLNEAGYALWNEAMAQYLGNKR